MSAERIYAGSCRKIRDHIFIAIAGLYPEWHCRLRRFCLKQSAWDLFRSCFAVVPHAYSYFHISGVHYLTVFLCAGPSMEVLLWFYKREMKKTEKILSLILTGVALLIPVLCVSRFQLIFAVILAVLTL